MSEQPYSYTGQTVRQPRMEEPRQVEIPGCTLVQDLIPLYLDGEVSPESHVLIADHVQQCPRCSGYLAGARSMRTQILHDQQAVRAASSAGPTVAQVRQPITSNLGLRLWQTLMLLTYSFGLVMAAVGFGEHAPELIMVGGVITLLAVGGLIKAGSLGTRFWRWLMLLTGAVGLLAALIGLTDGGPGSEGIAAWGLGLIGLAAWGRWLGKAQPSSGLTQPLRTGPNTAMLTAVLSVLGALGCAGMMTIALVLLLTSGPPEQRIIGTALLLVSGTALLAINQRRGWVPGLAIGLTAQQMVGYGLIAGGLLLITFLAQGLMAEMLSVLMVMAVGGGIAMVGYRLVRPKQP